MKQRKDRAAGAAGRPAVARVVLTGGPTSLCWTRHDALSRRRQLGVLNPLLARADWSKPLIP